MIKNCLLFTCFAMSCLYAKSQDLRKLGLNSSWNTGNIQLSNGPRLEGLIRYNDKEGIVSFKENKNDSTTQSFKSSLLFSMEYFDSEIKMSRRFISLSTMNLDKKGDIALFEVIKEFDQFAVVAFKGDVKSIESMYSKNIAIGAFGFVPNNSGSILKQYEGFYFIGVNGIRELYLILEFKDVDKGIYEYAINKGKVVDSSLPGKYFGDKEWNKIRSSMKQKKIKANNKEGLLEMLSQYELMITKK